MSLARKTFWSFYWKAVLPSLLLLAVLYVIIPRTGGREEARIPAARADIASLQVEFDEFMKDCGRHPTTAEGLNALLSCPTNLSGWRGPYLKDQSALPRDPWGHPYIYVCPGVHRTNEFDLYSYGPDGISRSGGNDPDDINNWSSR